MVLFLQLHHRRGPWCAQASSVRQPKALMNIPKVALSGDAFF
jgi:hypothetical protein